MNTACCFTLRYGYIFMNKISMSQTCLYTISYQIATGFFTPTSHYRGHSAIVGHNTNLATVHSRVTVGGCLMEYEYKLCDTLILFINMYP